MSWFVWLPTILFVVVFAIVAGVAAAVEVAAWRRARLLAALRARRRFRPVVIQGGRAAKVSASFFEKKEAKKL